MEARHRKGKPLNQPLRFDTVLYCKWPAQIKGLLQGAKSSRALTWNKASPSLPSTLVASIMTEGLGSSVQSSTLCRRSLYASSAACTGHSSGDLGLLVLDLGLSTSGRLPLAPVFKLDRFPPSHSLIHSLTSAPGFPFRDLDHVAQQQRSF